MAFIQLESDNPKFSFLIRKNPASGMIVKQLRHGLLFGYYSKGNDRQFNCWFKDSGSQVSYDVDKEFEFNDVTRYSAASFINNCLDEFFHDVNVKELEDDVEGFENSLYINCIRARERGLDIFRRSFDDFTLEYEPMALGFFKVRIQTRQTLRKLLCFAGILSLINAIQNRELKIVDDKLLIKYAKFIQYLDAPYFVRYQFKANLIHRGKLFDEVREYLDTETIKFAFGHNFSQRLHFVDKNIVGETIIDMGCGEGQYLRFAKKVGQYFAIDRDEICREQTCRRIEKLELDNVAVLEAFGQLPDISGKKTILLTEVIEHNSKEEAFELLKQCLLPESRIIVTTPNRDFNVHYTFDDDDVETTAGDNVSVVPVAEAEPSAEPLRHHGHVFEFTDDEFRAFISESVVGKDAKIQFVKLGDSVDGVTPQSAALVDIP